MLLLFNVLVILLFIFWNADAWPSNYVTTIRKTLTFLDGLSIIYKKSLNDLNIFSSGA